MEEMKIDLRSLVFDILKNIWLMLLICVAVMLGGHFIIKAYHEPVYTSQLSYVVVSNEATVVSNQGNQDKLVLVVQEVLESNILRSSIEDTLGYEENEHMSAEISTEIITTQNINESEENINIIVVTVTDDDPINAYYAAKAIISNVGTVSEYINKNALLTVLEKPSIPLSDSAAVNYVKMDIFIFAAAFILLCVLTAIVSMRRDSIRKSEEVMQKLGVRLLASLPDVSFKSKKHGGKTKRLLISNSRTGFYYIENIKKIRSKIEIEKPDEGGMTIIAASVMPQEGRTTIAANLAMSLAMRGSKVLLADMDFKNPSLHKVLGFDGELASITDFLDGEKSLGQTLRTSHHMRVLFQEKPAENSAEYIDSRNMKIFLEGAKSNFDYIIIDTSPVSVSADVEVLSGIVDYAVLAVREDTATSAQIKETIDIFDRNKCSLIGCVFNKDSRNARESSGGYYGRYSGYDNYSGYNRRERS